MNSPLTIDPEFESKIPRQNNQNSINLIVQDTDFVLEGKKYRHIARKHTYIVEGLFRCAAAKFHRLIRLNNQSGNCALLQKQKKMKKFRKNYLIFDREVSV